MTRALTCPRVRNSARPSRRRCRRKPRISVPYVKRSSGLRAAVAGLGFLLLTGAGGGGGSGPDPEARPNPAMEREPADQDADDDERRFQGAQASGSRSTARSTAPRKSRSGIAPSNPTLSLMTILGTAITW